MNATQSKSWVLGLTMGVVVFGALFGGIVYGSDARVIGIGNSANTFGADEPRPKLAKLIVSLDAAPEISEETLSGVYEAVAEKALTGDLEAATVLFEIAAAQREARALKDAGAQQVSMAD